MIFSLCSAGPLGPVRKFTGPKGPVLHLLFLTLLTSSVFAQSPSTKHNILSRIERASYGPTFSVVAGKIRDGYDLDKTYAQLDTLIARPYGDMFWMYGCAGLYFATQDVLRPAYKDRIRECWKHFTPYRGDTENHFLMYYGSLLLMSQVWPGLADSEWFMGKSSKEIYDESKEYLDHWIDETVRYSQTEWSSPRYGYYYITPLILLAEYTKDPRLQHRFEMLLEWTLADYASDYLAGCYCGAHSRVSDECAIDPRKSEITAYGEYFFGDTITHLEPDVAFAALSHFECPKIIRQIATDRSQPYEQFSYKRGRQMIRYMDKWSQTDSSHDSTFHAPVYKYEYMTKDYCLGSMQGGIVQPIQQQSWSLVFNSDKPHNIITGLHPYVSAEELGMFFPEYPSFMLERIGNVKKGYTNENKWVGGSPYERIYQDKNVLLALYDLPDSVKFRHVDLYVPPIAEFVGEVPASWVSDGLTVVTGNTRVDSTPCFPPDTTHVAHGGMSQWLVYRVDSTLIGIYMLTHFNVSTTTEGTHLRSIHPYHYAKEDSCGFVICCGTTRDISVEKFNQRLRQFDIPYQPMHGSWGDELDKVIAADHKVRTKSEQLFKSPYLESKKGSGVLTMRYKGEERVLDFRE